MAVQLLDQAAIESLEMRVNTLHQSIFSNDAPLTGDMKKPMEVLEQGKCTLREVESRHAVVTQLWKKLEKLEEYLTSGFLDKIAMNEEVKTSLILANKENIVKLSAHLKELNAVKDAVNDSSLKEVPEHSSKLAPILQLHFDQQEEALSLGSRVDVLLTAYNNVISTLSKQFMLWNNMVTQCELALDMESDVIE